VQANTKKLKAREEFMQYTKDVFKSSLGQDSKRDSFALLKFYVEEIHNKCSTPIDEEDFNDGYVDNANDLGIDFIHRDDGQVLVIQTKFRGKTVPEKPTEILHFQNIFNRLLLGQMQPNKKLAGILSSIDFDTDEFKLLFITFGALSGQAREQTTAGISYPKSHSGLDDRCSWEYYDEQALDEALRNARSISAGNGSSEFELVAAGKKSDRITPIVVTEGKHRCCILVVVATKLVDLLNKDKDRLFNLNIRNYIGNTRTNKKIVETAFQTPSEFFFFNNGVSCVATSMTVEGDRVHTRGLQVVNGAQTLKALHRAASKFKAGEPIWPETKPLVLVRITEVGESYGSSGRFREDITRFNNTQNVIKQSDFRSNDPIQVDLERKFKLLHRFGRIVQYTPKRTDRKLPQSDVIRLEEFAKVSFAFLRDPVSFSGSTSFLFDESDKGGYIQVFGDGKEIYSAMPEGRFKLLAAVWWMAQAFADRLKFDKLDSSLSSEKRNALERKWTLLFLARIYLERRYGDKYVEILGRSASGEWILGEKPEGVWFEKLYETCKQALQWMYVDAASKPGFVHRNWMRSESTVKALENYARTAPWGGLDPGP
jgi:hypothetical protein